MKNYLNFENDIKNLESEIEKLKDPYNQEGLSEVDTQKISSTQAELDEKLKDIMEDIHDSCVEYGKNDDGSIDYVKGANIAGFVKVADAMLAQGII